MKQLATGSIADVLLARASGLEGFARHVVIKRIHPELAREERFVTAFLEEARIAASLHHQHIVQVHDIGDEGGSLYFAMEYVHGEDCRKLLNKIRERNEQMPLQHVISIVMATAAGLHYAHEQVKPSGESKGIIHRDVSPANILIGYDGSVKLVDFGLAKAAQRSTNATQSGTLKGKSSYMSPEQCTGRTLDRRTDTFSLGIVLFELLTAQRLFKGANEFMTMAAIVDGEIPRPSTLRADVPPALDEILLRALSRAPQARYQTAESMRESLEAFALAQELRTSHKALADYLASVFGERQEPWLADPEPEPRWEQNEETHAGLVGVPRNPKDLAAQFSSEGDSPMALAQSLGAGEWTDEDEHASTSGQLPSLRRVGQPTEPTKTLRKSAQLDADAGATTRMPRTDTPVNVSANVRPRGDQTPTGVNQNVRPRTSEPARTRPSEPPTRPSEQHSAVNPNVRARPSEPHNAVNPNVRARPSEPPKGPGVYSSGKPRPSEPPPVGKRGPEAKAASEPVKKFEDTTAVLPTEPVKKFEDTTAVLPPTEPVRRVEPPTEPVKKVDATATPVHNIAPGAFKNQEVTSILPESATPGFQAAAPDVAATAKLKRDDILAAARQDTATPTTPIEVTETKDARPIGHEPGSSTLVEPPIFDGGLRPEPRDDDDDGLDDEPETEIALTAPEHMVMAPPEPVKEKMPVALRRPPRSQDPARNELQRAPDVVPAPLRPVHRVMMPGSPTQAGMGAVGGPREVTPPGSPPMVYPQTGSFAGIDPAAIAAGFAPPRASSDVMYQGLSAPPSGVDDSIRSSKRPLVIAGGLIAVVVTGIVAMRSCDSTSNAPSAAPADAAIEIEDAPPARTDAAVRRDAGLRDAGVRASAASDAGTTAPAKRLPAKRPPPKRPKGK